MSQPGDALQRLFQTCGGVFGIVLRVQANLQLLLLDLSFNPSGA